MIYEWVNREDMRDLMGTLYPVSEYEHEKWIQNVTMEGNQKFFACFRVESEGY